MRASLSPPAVGTSSTRGRSFPVSSSRKSSSGSPGSIECPPRARIVGSGGKLGRVGDGGAAGEALADVDGRPPVDEALAGEQRHVLGRAERDDGAGIPPGERSTGK